MRRLILGLAAFAFLGLVGAQSVHAHANPAVETGCGVCVVMRQSACLAPSDSPAVFVELRWAPLPELSIPAVSTPALRFSRARAPPLRP